MTIYCTFIFTIIYPTILSVYPSVSKDATQINQLFNWFILAAGLVFIAITGSLTYILIRYNKKKTPAALNQREGNKPLEIGIVLLAFALVGFFLIYTIKTMSIVQRVQTYEKPDLVITGHQWWWEIYYPKEGITTANELHVKAGKQLLVGLTSADVIHDWWVPAMGRKMDMIPGQNNFLYIQAQHPGIYNGTCSEFCGKQHAWMRIKVFAEDSTQHARWIAHQQQSANASLSTLAHRGKLLFEQKACASCHQIKGVTDHESEGPDLTHVASRTTLLAGKEYYSLANLKKWIADPQHEKPGANMPDFILSDDEVNAIATYLNEMN